MKVEKYYIPINTTSLAHYISKGIILASSCYKNRPQDIQNVESDYILLSKSIFVNDSNCSIEIILTDEEIEKYIKPTQYKDIFLYKYPIPLSRITKIYFLDENEQKNTIYLIEKGESSFVNKNLVTTIQTKSIYIENLKINDKCVYSDELKSNIDTFDKVLGGIAFVRYDLDGKYSKNYFSILSYFNKVIKDEYLKSDNKPNTSFNGVFDGSGNWESLYPLLYERIEEKDVIKFQKQENAPLMKSITGLWEYEKIVNNKKTYLMAILNNYGEESVKPKKTKDLIADFRTQKIILEKQEGISLLYGINNGYSKFRSKYGKKVVKFKMDSLLDYYTIESIFQKEINKKDDIQKLEYIDNIGIEKEIELPIDYEYFKVLDEIVITDKKTIVKEFEDNKLINSNGLLDFIEKIFRNIKNHYDKKINDYKKSVESLNLKLKKSEEENENLKKNDIKSKRKIETLKYKNIELEKNLKKQININLSLKKRIFDFKKQSPTKNNINGNKKEMIKEFLEINNKTMPELKKLADEKNISYDSKIKKDELIEKIFLCEKEVSQKELI